MLQYDAAITRGLRQGILESGAIEDLKLSLVGRCKELAAASRALAGSNVTGVLIAGPTGIGKTRLASEIVKDACANEAMPLISLRAFENAGFDHATATLRELLDRRPKRPVLLYVDDLQFLPERIIELLVLVARSRQAKIIAAINTEFQLTRTAHSLWKDQLLYRIDVECLDPYSARQLANTMSHWPLPRIVSADLAQLSMGNPLLLRELVHAFNTHTQDTGDSQVGTSRLFIRSPRIGQLMEETMQRLHGPAQSALELISLTSSARLSALQQIVGNETLLKLEELHLIKTEGAYGLESVAISHPLLAQTIRERIGPLRRAHHLRSWLAELPYDRQTRSEQRRSVEWHLEAGVSIHCDTMLRATQQALQEHDHTSAMRISDAAWQRYPTMRVAEVRAQALLAAAEFSELDRMLKEFTSKIGPLPQSLAQWQARALLLQGKFTLARAIIHALEGPDHHLLAGLSAYLRGDFSTCLHYCEPLTSDINQSRRVEAVVLTMAALCHQGKPQDALKHYRCYKQGISNGHAWALHADSLEEMHALALHISGDLPRAESVLREAYRDASSRQHLRLEAQRGLALGFTLLESGKIEESIKYFEFTPTYFVGWPLWHDRALINRVLASSYLPHSSDQQTLNINIEGIRSSCYGVYLSLAQAWQAWARADSPEALRILRCAAEQAVSRNAFSDVAVAAHEMARMGFSQYALPYLSVPVQGNFLQARLDYAKALINCNVKLLGKSARAFVEAGAHLYAAEAYTELSQLYKYIGSERASTGAVVLARTHLKKCGDVETFTLRFLGHSSPLTGRERTIADLAARGFSDREIADHLSISPRTVGNTLYRVYRKLGISGRHLLAGRPMEIK